MKTMHTTLDLPEDKYYAIWLLELSRIWDLCQDNVFFPSEFTFWLQSFFTIGIGMQISSIRSWLRKQLPCHCFHAVEVKTELQTTQRSYRREDTVQINQFRHPLDKVNYYQWRVLSFLFKNLHIKQSTLSNSVQLQDAIWQSLTY